MLLFYRDGDAVVLLMLVLLFYRDSDAVVLQRWGCCCFIDVGAVNSSTETMLLLCCSTDDVLELSCSGCWP
jgi:hypothetical protein